MLKIIISPAKKMNIIDEYSCTLTHPAYIEETQYLHHLLKGMSREDLKQLWKCSDKLATQNYERLHMFDPGKCLTPALLTYEGIQYQYMAPHIFSDSEWAYVTKHLRILSGFYGILRPTDGVIPYRLEMQARLANKEGKDLYAFWGAKLYSALTASETEPEGTADGASKHSPAHPANQNIQILNLASSEYSKAVLPFIQPPVTYVTCIFGEHTDGRVKMKGTQAKIARGEMVRWMAEHQIEHLSDIRKFDRLNYQFREELSTETEYVFLCN